MAKFLRLDKGPRPPVHAKRSVFHGVSIDSRHQVCSAVAELHSKRFLSEEAPILPLDRCPHPLSCQCVYKHFGDRRTGLRRDSDEGLPIRDFPNELRCGTGRRITDGGGTELEA